MQQLKDLLGELGLPPVAVAAIVFATAILVFLIQRVLDRREKRETARLENLLDYARLQEQALLKAFRMLYEQVDLNTLSEEEFYQLVCRADEMIMEPFTHYRRDLPDDIQAKIYNDFHSPIAQFKPDPARPREITPEAKHALSQYKGRFLKQIESTKTLIQKHLRGTII